MSARRATTRVKRVILYLALAAVAAASVPAYLSFLKRARQVEAAAALHEIGRLETLYHAFNKRYGSLDDIGYQPLPESRYYKISLHLTCADGDRPAGFEAVARGNVDSDEAEDVWVLVRGGAPRHQERD